MSLAKKEGGLHCRLSALWSFLCAIWTPATMEVSLEEREGPRREGPMTSINNSFGFSVSSCGQTWLSFSASPVHGEACLTVLVDTRLSAALAVVTVHERICNCLILVADGNYLEDIWVL